MKHIPQYSYYKKKSVDELRVDVVGLHYIKPYFSTKSIHTLTYYDITFISEGSGFFTVGDQTHIVKPCDVIFTKPGEVRNWDNKNIKNGHVLIFEEEFMLSFFNDRELLQNLSFFSIGRYSVKTTLGNETYVKLCDLLSKIKTVIKETNDKHTLRALLYEALIVLNRAYINEHNVLPVLPEENKKVKNRYVNEFLSLVNTNYIQQHAINYYAARLSITPNYLNEVIKKSIGMNAKLYIQNRIIQEAKRMLTYTDMSISAIARTLCFENSSYFIRFFRNQTQHTPLQYRNLLKGQL
ncbi:MAG: helix-turn-helix transcriptional regulator [Tannerellaceae bacterium]|jgi:AraC-like DNA-binding protein|nr:helix-turn-helix transcriptional regulator [Tannerellaceae bacterium]